MQYWLKSLGTGDCPLQEDWYVEEGAGRRQWFACKKSGRPSFTRGDQVLLYAAGHQRIIGAMRVTHDPFKDAQFVWNEGGFDGDRWPWVVRCEPLLMVPHVSRGATLDRAGVGTLSVRSQSHIVLEPQQYRAGVAGLAEAAASADGEGYGALRDRAT